MGCERTLTVSASRSRAPYASLLTLSSSGLNLDSIQWVDEDGVLELNLDGVRIKNDITIARLIAQSTGEDVLTGNSLFEKAQIDEVVSLCEQIVAGFLDASQVLPDIQFSPEGTLFEKRVTLADFCVFSVIASDQKLLAAYKKLFDVIVSNEKLREAHVVAGVVKDLPSSSNAKKVEKQKDEGKFFDLPGAEMGKVVVRFPPEASGYLHIGHAKAALLNQYYQQAFKGKLIMRFDDTNPAKENSHFEEVIKEDLAMLKVVPDIWTHSSDHFELMLVKCEQLLKEGKAFVDDTDMETMRSEREQRVDSRNRNNTPEQNLALWNEMKAGSDRGKQCCVRIKIDMKSNNGAMRDPTIYRCKVEEHVRTGNKYKVYPTYDFACPIVDSIEGVTHSLRTTEYHDRDDQFFFICDALGLRKPHVWAYARLNMTNSVMSKRKLTWFVDEGHVEGWDDPRLPTVRGVLRRGLTVEGLKQFIVAQGGSRSVVVMEWDKIWAFNKKVIDPVAPRYTALDTTSSLVAVLLDSAVTNTSSKVSLHPKNAEVGEKVIYHSKKLFIEQVDAKLIKDGDVVTFVNWGNVKIEKVNRKGEEVTEIRAKLQLDNTDFKKTLKVTWIADTKEEDMIAVVGVDYDHIISKPIIGKEEDWKEYINYDSVHYTKMSGEPALKSVKKGDIIQLQRKGFYICDREYCAKSAFCDKETPIVLIAIPDGHVKEQPTSTAANKAKVAATSPAATPSGSSALDLYNDLEKQGVVVRDLKAKDAKGQATKDAIAKLLELKQKYKEVAGSDYKSGSPPAAPVAAAPVAGNAALDVYNKLEKQGLLVRELKGKDPKGEATKAAIQGLLDMKKQYKEVTGQEYKAGSPPAAAAAAAVSPSSASTVSSGSGSSSLDLYNQLEKQGLLVREQKANDAKSDATKEAIKTLLELKKTYKDVTGQEYKTGSPPAGAASPAPVPTVSSGSGSGSSALDLYNELEKQGVQVREQKAKDAKSDATKEAIKTLLELKKTYKDVTGQEYKSGSPPAAAPAAAPAPSSATATPDALTLYNKLQDQGTLVRDLKAKEPKGQATKDAIAELLRLKTEYKKVAGSDYVAGKPPAAAAATAPASVPSAAPAVSELLDLYNKLEAQGATVRELKGKDAKSQATKDSIAELLRLKGEYKKVSGGQEYKSGSPPAVSSAPAPIPSAETPSADLQSQIDAQGALVRELKGTDAKSQETKDAIAKLLELKKKFKETTGQEYKPSAAPAQAARQEKKPEKKETKVKAKKVETTSAVEKSDGKKQTKLGIETPKEENYSEWYSQVIVRAEMIEYYDVSGCYVLRPWSFAIWEFIKKWFDTRIKRLGVRNSYFPMFVSQAALEREREHIADFAPEVAWVTRAGSSEMAEPIAIRPTSETVMYPSYKKWVQSHRDLPIKLNQWCNVVRWEFKHPTPFLRTREFLWQEGHTAYANPEDAEKEVFQILDLYAGVYEELLAIPVVKGRKSEKEKFAGGVFTTTVEAYIAVNGRGVQGATSHHLGQNFSKMFDISFEDPKGTGARINAFQNSWGLTTRTIGAMVMVHGDNRGLVLPPRVAAVQAIVIPVGLTASTPAEVRQNIEDKVKEIVDQLNQSGLRAEADVRDNYTPGWKFNHWEVKGVPIRVELGPKDLEKKQVTLVIRHNGAKKEAPLDGLSQSLTSLLEEIHTEMFNKAKTERDAHLRMASSLDEMKKLLEEKCIVLAGFCGRPVCEENVKRDTAREEGEGALMGAKTLCIPLEQPSQQLPTSCVHPECKEKPTAFALFGTSY